MTQHGQRGTRRKALGGAARLKASRLPGAPSGGGGDGRGAGEKLSMVAQGRRWQRRQGSPRRQPWATQAQERHTAKPRSKKPGTAAQAAPDGQKRSGRQHASKETPRGAAEKRGGEAADCPGAGAAGPEAPKGTGQGGSQRADALTKAAPATQQGRPTRSNGSPQRRKGKAKGRRRQREPAERAAPQGQARTRGRARKLGGTARGPAPASNARAQTPDRGRDSGGGRAAPTRASDASCKAAKRHGSTRRAQKVGRKRPRDDGPGPQARTTSWVWAGPSHAGGLPGPLRRCRQGRQPQGGKGSRAPGMGPYQLAARARLPRARRYTAAPAPGNGRRGAVDFVRARLQAPAKPEA